MAEGVVRVACGGPEGGWACFEEVDEGEEGEKEEEERATSVGRACQWMGLRAELAQGTHIMTVRSKHSHQCSLQPNQISTGTPNFNIKFIFNQPILRVAGGCGEEEDTSSTLDRSTLDSHNSPWQDGILKLNENECPASLLKSTPTSSPKRGTKRASDR